MIKPTVFLQFLLLFLLRSAFAQQAGPNFKDVEYGKIDTTSLKLDIYLPKNTTTPCPVIVWIHGGAWMSGSKENVNGLYMIPLGYALVSVNYRLSQQAIHPAQINDCKGAIRWIRANAARYGFDPNRIGVWGSSAGGHLAALLGTSGGVPELEGSVGGNVSFSSRVQAVCDWFGPSDMLTIGDYPSSINHDAPDSPEGRLLGGAPKQVPEKARSASPVTYVTADDPPFLIHHGTNDMTVPFHQSVELDSLLRLRHVACSFRPIQGAGHGGGGFNADSTRQQVIRFFDQYLRQSSMSVSPPVSEPRLHALSVSPNPVSGEAKVTFSLKEGALVQLQLYDLLGRILLMRKLGWQEPGTHTDRLDAGTLPHGHYYLLVVAGKERAGRVITKVK